MAEIYPFNYVANLIHAFPCLYGLWNNMACVYDPRNAPINFTLGEAVATLGLIFAVIQLTDLSWKVTLNIKEWYLRNMIWFFSGIALASIFFASVIPQLPPMPAPYGYPVFWEQIGFIAFIIAPLFHYFIAKHRKNMFNKSRAKRFYDYIIQVASSGLAKEIEVAVGIVWESLDKITEAISFLEHNADNIDRDHYSRYGSSLLNILLSEKSVADYIVTSRIGFLFKLMANIKEKGLTKRSVGMGFQRLVRRLFENPDSYLFKQLDYQGITRYAPLYDIIFGDTYFLQNFSVLAMWNSYSSAITDPIRLSDDYIQVFLKSLGTAIKANKFGDGLTEEITHALYNLDDFAQSLSWNADKPQKEASERLLGHIGAFYGLKFLELYREAYTNETISEREKKSEKVGFYKNSITATYAEVLVKFLGHLASMDDRSMERMKAMNATDILLPTSNDEGIFDNIRTCFFQYMWEEIDNNVKRGYFPAVLRIYIELIYLNFPTLPAWYKAEREKLIEYLNQELKPRLLQDEYMANQEDKKETELLPDNIIFDRDSQKFYIINRDGTKNELR